MAKQQQQEYAKSVSDDDDLYRSTSMIESQPNESEHNEVEELQEATERNESLALGNTNLASDCVEVEQVCEDRQRCQEEASNATSHAPTKLLHVCMDMDR